ncbi:ubiquitin-like protein (HubA) [Pochonia chlamydosporia 170]|uniref:Ubiquitin-like modifier HUB1 n=1 Tax=Pochonia chlamydosporia 170 TaxID=1380566 RepID=A0A179FY86_METCM|nr:ubiquitin-like protein (HubA) [Pochonia chlamydosporia 170]OAQ70198.1 ubiquitin-like protein (HubA) [Pochonia chlamydosporia 170]
MADEPPRRSRSRSPSRRGPRPNRGGFRWKDNNRRNDDRDSGRRRDFRDRSRDRDSGRDRGRGYRDGDGDRDRDRYRDGPRDRNRDRERDNRDRDHKGNRDDNRRGPDRLRSPRRNDRDSRDKGDSKKEKASKPAPAPAAGGEEMIIVHVNDRLGSKSAVPCLPSDTVGQFKIMVAARIGREPNQIMLRRQGERPFKDHITLEDYGISNGVQLDLEIDTGD